MISPSKFARTTIGTMLADPTVGFNSTLQTLCNEYRTTGFTIDYSARSKNFYQGFYQPKDLMATTTMKAPAQCLYTIKTQNTNEEKFCTFSGFIQIGIDTIVESSKSAAPNDAENLADCVEGAFYNLFNGETNQHCYGPVTYAGDLAVTRSPMQLAGENWRQVISARMTVQLTIL